MKKSYFILAAIASIVLVSCSNEEYVGDENLLNENKTGAILFSSSTPRMTRSDATTTGKLGYNFVVFGYKTPDGGSAQTVFDNYQVNWSDNSALTSTTNSANWEYVGYKNVPNGVTTNAGVTSFASNTTDNNGEKVIDQTIKYWDFATGTEYDFIAYSLGTGVDDDANASTPNTFAKASAITTTGYSLTGSAAQLGTCYISKKEHTNPASPSPQVQLDFVNFLSKIQLKFFETIPGYAVKELKFYSASGTLTDSDESGDADGLVPALYGADNSIKGGGVYSITFDTNGDPVVTLTSGTGYTHTNEVDFAAISSGVYLDHYASTLDYKEAAAAGIFLARESSVATSDGAVLTLKIDYTLVSRDGTGETIQITGKTAQIPAQYTQWKSNFAYTYVFKITDEDLTPITLDAVIVDTDQGTQETITTVHEPSITTFGYDATNNEYLASSNDYPSGTDVYATVMYGGSLETLNTSNTKLYTVTATAPGTVTEASVLDALLNASILNTAQATAATVHATPQAITNDNFLKQVPAEDGTTKTLDENNNKAIKFTTSNTGSNPVYYAIVYEKTAATYTVDEGKTYADETAFNNAGTLYTSSACTEVATWGNSSTTYYKRTAVSNKGVYAVKIVTCPAP